MIQGHLSYTRISTTLTDVTDWRPEVVSSPRVEPAPRGQLTPGIHPPGTSLIRKPGQENAVTGRKLTGEEKLARLEAELASRRGG